MAAIIVRDLPDEVQQRLKIQAAQHNRSLEAEVRAILTASVARSDLVQTWLDVTRDLRGEDLPLPERSAPRVVDLS